VFAYQLQPCVSARQLAESWCRVRVSPVIIGLVLRLAVEGAPHAARQAAVMRAVAFIEDLRGR